MKINPQLLRGNWKGGRALDPAIKAITERLKARADQPLGETIEEDLFATGSKVRPARVVKKL